MVISHALTVHGKQSKETPLYEATRGGFLDVCKYLIESGADINAKNDLSTILSSLGITHGLTPSL